MKKVMAGITALAMAAALAGCGGNDGTPEATEETSSSAPSSAPASEDTASSAADTGEPASVEALEATIEQDVENSIAAMNAEYESLVADITTYDQYRENADRVKAFYDKVFTDTEALCIRMCEYSIAYAEAVVGADASSEEKYGALDGLYDCLYDDAGEEIYDET